MFCSSCGKECSETAEFCPSCGAALKKDTSGSAVVEPQAIVNEKTAASPEAPSAAPESPSIPAGNVGAQGNPVTPSQTPASSTSTDSGKVVAGVLAILFGTFGVHKFYLGYKTAGFIMLAVTVVSCCSFALVMQIIGIIEGVIYLSKSDADFKKTYVDSRKEWF